MKKAKTQVDPFLNEIASQQQSADPRKMYRKELYGHKQQKIATNRKIHLTRQNSLNNLTKKKRELQAQIVEITQEIERRR